MHGYQSMPDLGYACCTCVSTNVAYTKYATGMQASTHAPNCPAQIRHPKEGTASACGFRISATATTHLQPQCLCKSPLLLPHHPPSTASMLLIYPLILPLVTPHAIYAGVVGVHMFVLCRVAGSPCEAHRAHSWFVLQCHVSEVLTGR